MNSLRHPNIVSVYGACLRKPRIGVIMEYCVNGALTSFIEGKKLKWERKLQILIDVARGMQFLHSKNVIHRDLKSDNILLDDHMVAKLVDFGLARIKQLDQASSNMKMTTRVGTSNYMAPELVLNNDQLTYDEKCDVYSFAIVMFELLADTTEPYGKGEYHVELKVANNPTFRPTLPINIEDQFLSSSASTSSSLGSSGIQMNAQVMLYIDLMTKCWSHSPSQRPSFTVIVNELQRIAKYYNN